MLTGNNNDGYNDDKNDKNLRQLLIALLLCTYSLY